MSSLSEFSCYDMDPNDALRFLCFMHCYSIYHTVLHFSRVIEEDHIKRPQWLHHQNMSLVLGYNHSQSDVIILDLTVIWK
ncbi:hypothetical protein Nepgr_025115 [Nepenthes gracilis]|uniref:Uncharacterized protein n=1 Tax=Nepenthes gracilis TaxID=150966 RepID=A0AAD3T5V9_NEPGR|nr:hypothetical protein Nepgr_025115 [Nepenthes gracilis]